MNRFYLTAFPGLECVGPVELINFVTELAKGIGSGAHVPRPDPLTDY
jgi:hypothetical protein